MELNPDFQEFLRSFVAREVRFLIIGGYALAAHGHPRYTKDLDVWVWIDLRTNKLATGRLRDRADAAELPGPGAADDR